MVPNGDAAVRILCNMDYIDISYEYEIATFRSMTNIRN